MRVYTLVFLFAAVVLVECGNTFLGTSVMRPLIYHHDVHYSSRMLKKRVENLYFAIPQVPSNYGRTIQGILAYDLTHSGASVNITQGGLNYNFVNLRMKSDRGKELHYDVYIYA